MKKLIFILAIIGLSSCNHKREGEIIMDKNGNFFRLSSENGLMPSNAYRLIPIDTNYYLIKFKSLQDSLNHFKK